MKKTPALFALTLTTLSLIATLNAFAGTLYPVVMGNRWGFVDKNGKYVINPQFDEANSFADGLARVKVSRKTGYVDENGRYIWNPTN